MPLLYALTFLSGFAALVYQMLWIRGLALVLGSTTAAICTVVAAFMGGLALGSALFGRRADRSRNLLGLYALLEVGIGVAALALLFAIPWLESLYPALARAAAEWPGMLALLRFLVAFALLLVPTSLMGGTFPVLVKAMAREIGGLGGTVGRLYGANTIGAVAGCLAAGLWMMGALGLSGTCAVAVALNVVAAIGAWLLARWRAARPEPAPAPAPATAPKPKVKHERAAKSKHASAHAAHSVSPAPAAHAAPAASPDARTRAVVVAVGISGAIALGYEIVWSRALAIVLGHSIYAFTFVLSTYLAGLALGGLIVAPFLDRWRDPARAFAYGLLALGAVSGVSLWLVPVLPFRDYKLGVDPLDYAGLNLACTSALLLAPTLLLGALLPLAIRASAGDLERAGSDVGRVYAWNTLGSIAGSLLTGFVLIPRLGAQSSFALLVVLNLVLALFVGVRVRWTRGWTGVAALSIAAGGIVLARSGGSPILRDKAVARVEDFLKEPVELRYYGEDEVTSVGLIRGRSGMERLFTNGVLMTHWGIETLWMAHLPLAFVEAPKDVLVLCLGMGNTYRAATLHPVRVTAVELSPKIVEAYGVMHAEDAARQADDRITVGDARNAVLVSDRLFDVITVDPPPPLYAAGTVNFHTREFFELLRARLSPKGVVCMWVPFYDCTIDEYKSILRTFRAVFPRTWAWVPSPRVGVMGVYLLGLGTDVATDEATVLARLQSPLVEADVKRFAPQAPLALILPEPILRDAQIDGWCGEQPFLVDDQPFLEFPLFRNAGRSRERMEWPPLANYVSEMRARAK